MKKNNGFALIELMLAFSIGAVLFLSIQKIYIWLTGATHNVRSNTIIEHEKMICYYHMGLDCRNFLVTNNFNRLCEIISELHKDKKKDEKNRGNNQQNNEKQQGKGKEDEEKKKEALEKEFKKIINSELPFLQKTDDHIICSFLSSRALLQDKEDSKKVRIEYSFEKIKNNPLLTNSYAFKRREMYDGEKKKPYTLLSYVENPVITLLFLEYEKEEEKKDEKNKNQSLIKEENNENNPIEGEEKNKKEVPTLFKKAIEKARYVSVDRLPEYTVQYCAEHSLIPYYIIIEGDIHVQDKKKTVPFVFYFPIASAESTYEMQLNYALKKKQKDKKKSLFGNSMKQKEGEKNKEKENMPEKNENQEENNEEE